MGIENIKDMYAVMKLFSQSNSEDESVIFGDLNMDDLPDNRFMNNLRDICMLDRLYEYIRKRWTGNLNSMFNKSSKRDRSDDIPDIDVFSKIKTYSTVETYDSKNYRIRLDLIDYISNLSSTTQIRIRYFKGANGNQKDHWYEVSAGRRLSNMYEYDSSYFNEKVYSRSRDDCNNWGKQLSNKRIPYDFRYFRSKEFYTHIMKKYIMYVNDIHDNIDGIADYIIKMCNDYMDFNYSLSDYYESYKSTATELNKKFK